DALAGRVVQHPVLVPLAGEEGADVPAPHGDDGVGGLDCLGGEDLRLLGGDVDADLGHGLDRHRVDLVGGHGPGGADLDPPTGEGGREARGHLGAAGVVDADEQNAGAI